MTYRFLIAVSVIAMSTLSTARAQDEPNQDEAKQVFESLFGEKIQSARTTFAKTDDVALAKELLAAANESTEHAGLLALLCDSAATLGANHPDGYETAIDALKLLVQHNPEMRDASASKLLMLRRRQYSAARTVEAKKAIGAQLVLDYLNAADALEAASDYAGAIGHMRYALQMATYTKSAEKEEIALRYKQLLAKKQMAEELTHLKSALKADPKDEAAATRLILLYVEVADDPEKARKYTFLVTDEKLKSNVSNAAKEDLKTLKETDALSLADWYLAFAKKVSARNPQAMFQRAYTYFQAYLQAMGPDGKGIGVVKAKLMVKQIQSIAKARGYSLEETTTTVAAADAKAALANPLAPGAAARNTLATLPTNLKPIRVPLAPTQGNIRAAKDLMRGASGGDIERIQQALADGGALNQPYGSSGTPLYSAVANPQGGRENLQMIKFLLGKGADPNFIRKDKKARGRADASVMAAAAQRGFAGTTRLLRQYGYKPTDNDFKYALQAKDPQWIAQLLTPKNVNAHIARDEKWTHHPLVYVLYGSKRSPALAARTLEAVKLMLAKGSDPNAPHMKRIGDDDYSGQRLTAYAAQNSTLSVYETLVKAGGKIANPLHDHINLGNVEGVEKYVTAATINPERGYGPLYTAMRARPLNPEVIEILLKKGADPNQPTNMTPLYWTIRYGAYDTRSKRVVELLLSHGAKANQLAHAEDRQMPLHIVASYMRDSESGVDIARMLVAKKADVNALDRRGRSPMAYLDSDNPIYQLLEKAGGKAIKKQPTTKRERKIERKQEKRGDSAPRKIKPPKAKK